MTVPQKIKTNILLVCNLLLNSNNRDSEFVTFNQVLRHSLSVEKTTPAFCEICKKFTPTNQYARVTELPQILSINCGLVNEKEMTFLRKQMNRNTSNGGTNEMTTQPPATSTPIKPCRYGANCSRVNCHFAHSDPKKVENNAIKSRRDDTPVIAAATMPSASVTASVRPSAWFPLQFGMEIDRTTDELLVSNVMEDGSTPSTGNEETSPADAAAETIPELVEKLTMNPSEEADVTTSVDVADDEEIR